MEDNTPPWVFDDGVPVPDVERHMAQLAASATGDAADMDVDNQTDRPALHDITGHVLRLQYAAVAAQEKEKAKNAAPSTPTKCTPTKAAPPQGPITMQPACSPLNSPCGKRPCLSLGNSLSQGGAHPVGLPPRSPHPKALTSAASQGHAQQRLLLPTDLLRQHSSPSQPNSSPAPFAHPHSPLQQHLYGQGPSCMQLPTSPSHLPRSPHAAQGLAAQLEGAHAAQQCGSHSAQWDHGNTSGTAKRGLIFR